MVSTPGSPNLLPQRSLQSGNDISYSGSVVVKHFRTSLDHYFRELLLLPLLSSLPVPRVLPGSQPPELRMSLIEGISGVQAVDQGASAKMLQELGHFLRSLQQLDARSFRHILQGEGDFVVHGDFAHYNCVLNRQTGSLEGVLDWENAHFGNKFEDLAWVEWQFRSAFPNQRWAISNLFQGYGEKPDRALLERIVEERLADLNCGQRFSDNPQSATVERITGNEVCEVLRFGQFEEMASFVAALSRFLNSPAGTKFLETGLPAEVWMDPSPGSGAAEVYLNRSACNAVAAGFGSVRIHGVHPLPNGCRRLLGPTRGPSWGVGEATEAIQSMRAASR